ncbi:MAG: hypothetical protein K8L99_05060 [Anaerolineae bacterium]|nr:hypothetical protein [Anaerolineae bacterium]
MLFNEPDLQHFLTLPTQVVRDIVHPEKLSVSLLLNGTRRWYFSEYFDTPPQDNSYFPHYLETVLIKLSQLLDMTASHGAYRIFVPVYSWYQSQRNPYAHQFLLKGIQALTNHPQLVDVYTRHNCQVRFYGDTSYMPSEIAESIQQPLDCFDGEPEHIIYFGVDGGNPYNHTFEIVTKFAAEHGRAPSWEDMVELYYGDRTIRRLEILIGFNRIYSRGGIPHLLEGGDRIYVTLVTPLVLSEKGLRTILHDYLYASHDFGRDYRDVHPNEIIRLKSFYDANRDNIVGLMRKYEDLVYPLPGIAWPEEMDHIYESIFAR